MIEIELKDFQVGKTYYLHEVRDKGHLPMSRKYKVVCTEDLSRYKNFGWYDFVFGSVKGINTKDIPEEIQISNDEDSHGYYRYYLCKSDEINEQRINRTIDKALREIIGDPHFRHYS
jgi:hypothetical protein